MNGKTNHLPIYELVIGGSQPSENASCKSPTLAELFEYMLSLCYLQLPVVATSFCHAFFFFFKTLRSMLDLGWGWDTLFLHTTCVFFLFPACFSKTKTQKNKTEEKKWLLAKNEMFAWVIESIFMSLLKQNQTTLFWSQEPYEVVGC